MLFGEIIAAYSDSHLKQRVCRKNWEIFNFKAGGKAMQVTSALQMTKRTSYKSRKEKCVL
jgi:hypothetical protein